jgi:hypothetical protein
MRPRHEGTGDSKVRRSEATKKGFRVMCTIRIMIFNELQTMFADFTSSNVLQRISNKLILNNPVP